MTATVPAIRAHLILRLDDGHEIDLGRVELPVRVTLGAQGPVLRGPGASDVATAVRGAFQDSDPADDLARRLAARRA